MDTGYYAKLQVILNTGDVGTVVCTAIAFLFFSWLIWHLTGVLNNASEDPAAKNANRLVAMLGAIFGWIIGIAFAPFSPEEQTHFEAISKVVSAFLSGYVVSKLDRFLEAKLFPVDEVSRDSWTRVGIFTAALLLVSVTVFVNRLYAFKPLGTKPAVSTKVTSPDRQDAGTSTIAPAANTSSSSQPAPSGQSAAPASTQKTDKRE